MRERDNFSARIRTLLASRAGYLCSNLSCRVMTIGPSREALDDVATVGVAAHIHAAAPGGPRYNAAMSPEERASIENGIWLCSTHATLVDRDVVRFTAEILRRWKAEHESYVEHNIGKIHTRAAIPTLGTRRISLEAARIVAERTFAWEYRLFAQLLRDEISRRIDDARCLRYGVALGQMHYVDIKQLFSKTRESMTATQFIVDSFMKLAVGPLAEAFDSRRHPGDPQLIEFTAHSIGRIHHKIIAWGLDWLHTRCKQKEAQDLLALLPNLLNDILCSIQQIPDRLDKLCEAASKIVTPEFPDHSDTLKIVLIIPETTIMAINAEIERLAPLIA